MKTFIKQYRRLSLGLLGALALTVAGASTMTDAVGDSTVGGLPSADGGDGSQNFYLSAPRDLVDDAIIDAWGDGFYVAVSLPDNRMWLEFYGDVSVLFNSTVLAAHPEIEVGLSAGFNGGGMLVMPEIDGTFSGRRIPVEMGFSWATPYGRIKPLLEGELSFHTTQIQTGQRAELEYLSFGGSFVISQDLK